MCPFSFLPLLPSTAFGVLEASNLDKSQIATLHHIWFAKFYTVSFCDVFCHVHCDSANDEPFHFILRTIVRLIVYFAYSEINWDHNLPKSKSFFPRNGKSLFTSVSMQLGRGQQVIVLRAGSHPVQCNAASCTSWLSNACYLNHFSPTRTEHRAVALLESKNSSMVCSCPLSHYQNISLKWMGRRRRRCSVCSSTPLWRLAGSEGMSTALLSEMHLTSPGVRLTASILPKAHSYLILDCQLVAESLHALAEKQSSDVLDWMGEVALVSNTKNVLHLKVLSQDLVYFTISTYNFKADRKKPRAPRQSPSTSSSTSETISEVRVVLERPLYRSEAFFRVGFLYVFEALTPLAFQGDCSI